ncbi:hypothetical protein GCM10010124_24240 [Pilimelia terevasa]|uniref:Uncharacterized protein n=1 Tax=Pilimelia terevasa TaxID=53372 RepID=A0A8J3BSF4_9ACTN|nr:hypothetical protein [Pilimelia terevasa]GGK30660.1 hypothetical protein GCM10010124_24240 [Pilimelia terevasa]
MWNPASSVAPVGALVADTQVTYGGVPYAANEIARGAAYELLSTRAAPGFTPSARPDAPWHLFVPAADVTGPRGPAAGREHETPLMVPLSRGRTWDDFHRLSQTPDPRYSPELADIRATAAVRRGTRMIKVLSARQVGGYLKGWLPAGFCYREWDVAHLRTAGELRVLRTDDDRHADSPDVAYALRWRAVDPCDYEVPTGAAYPGLVSMPSGYRVGPPLLGTGFTPSAQHVIPEFVTANLTDIPLPANTALLAYPGDGTEVVLFTFQPEQRGWLRMAGPAARHLLAGLGSAADQEYLPVPSGDRGTSRLVGRHQGVEHDTVADPPEEFRVLAMSRAARYPVETLARRTRFATWRGAACSVVGVEGAWVRLRLCRPDADQVVAIGAQCHERGVYEAWAPAEELADYRTVDQPYRL